VAGSSAAQTRPAQPPAGAPTPTKPQEPGQYRIAIRVDRVTTPVTITNPRGEYVVDIERPEVTLLDNKQPQQIELFELVSRPLSLVIIIDVSTRMAPLLKDIRPSGVLFTQLAMGETGEAAVLTYDRFVEVTQPFTNNADLIEKAFKTLSAGVESQTRLTDAIYRGLTMLQSRIKDRRGTIVVIGEGHDIGSESELGFALRDAQLLGVSIYTVELSTVLAKLKSKPGPAAPSPIPPGGRPSAPGAPVGVPQGATSSGNLVPILVDVIRGVKRVIWDKPMKGFAEGTGADHINVFSQKGIQEAVQKIANELHSQYLISYRPNNLKGPEFHTIEVRVNRPGLKTRTRPGYYYTPELSPESPGNR
jgi:VWFA-related protein